MTKINIVFLGSGSSIPTPERNHPGIFIEYEGDKFLWDCGEGTQRQMMIAGLKLMKIKKIFITHWHADHFAGIIGLIETFNLSGRAEPLEVYGPEASRFIDAFSELSYWDFGFEIKTFDVNYEENKISTIFENDKYKILSVPVKHSIPAVAYCFQEKDRWNLSRAKLRKYGIEPGPILDVLKRNGKIKINRKTIRLEDVATMTRGKKIVYSGDTSPCKNIVKLSKEADLLIHDATFLEEDVESRKKAYLKKNHTSVRKAAEIAKKAGVKKLILTHFSRRYNNVNKLKKIAQRVFKNTDVARDFKKITI
ncbi:MAG: ribonuclease Z [Candidatus Aenigmarchaeota archaeon]|nr:ribonuclease Z [Candidatus Aenigmarchaeota archaeon]